MKQRNNIWGKKPMEWENAFASHSTNKGLIFKIYKQFIQLSIKQTNNSIKKWVEDLNKTFFQRRHAECQQAYENMLIIAEY